jgi:hypothetical protein
MSNGSEPFYQSADGGTRLYGRPWEQAPMGRARIALCVLRCHRRVMWGTIQNDFEERCACGARRTNGGKWTGGGRLCRSAFVSPDDVDLAVETIYARQRRFRFLDWIDRP